MVETTDLNDLPLVPASQKDVVSVGRELVAIGRALICAEQDANGVMAAVVLLDTCTKKLASIATQGIA